MQSWLREAVALVLVFVLGINPAVAAIPTVEQVKKPGNESLLRGATPLLKAGTFTPRITGAMNKAGRFEVETPTPVASGTETISDEMRNKIQKALGSSEYHFIENKGQVNSKVRYYAKSRGCTIWFTDDEIVFDFIRPKQGSAENGTAGEEVLAERAAPQRQGDQPSGLHNRKKPREMERSVVRMTLQGASSHPAVSGRTRQKGVVNYLIGNDKSKWATNVSTYGEVYYTDIYAGIDLRFYTANGTMEYDFIVHPDADPGKIVVAFEGIETMVNDENGDLVAQGPFGELRQKSPHIYQNIAGEKVAVSGKFHVSAEDNSGSHEYRFQLDNYDRTCALVIDPVVYSTYLGETESDGEFVGDITVDSSGNAYVTGGTTSSDFPIKNALFPTPYGEEDAFITKLDPSGTALVYSTYLGGTDQDAGRGIAVDSSGNAYVTGLTDSSDFPTKNAPFPTPPPHGSFVTKLNASGTALVYSTYLGGTGEDSGHGIAVDSYGNAYVTGWTTSSDFPTKNAPFPTLYGYMDAFVTKLNASGMALDYSTYLGGTDYESGHGIAVDSYGNAYVTGITYSSDFPIKNAPFPKLYGYMDAFVTKLNASGTALDYSTYLGGTDYESGYGIAVDSSGNAYVTGMTYSSDFPIKNAPFPKLYGYMDAFVTKLNASGTALDYSTYLGGTDYESGYGIAVDSSGNAYVTGGTSSSDFPTKNAPFPKLYGYGDAFVTKLNASGTALDYSTYLGGTDYESGHGIAVDSYGNAYVTGMTYSSDFPIINAPFPKLYGYMDAFVTKLSTDNALFSGTVRDTNLVAQGNATVEVGGISTLTDSNGKFYFSDITPGTYPVTISKPGYTTLNQTVSIAPATTTIRDYQLAPTTVGKVEVVDVSGNYNGFLYYMAGTNLSVTYTANVAWGGHQPGTIRFITPKGFSDVSTSGTAASKTFNIANDFEPCTTLRVVAISADGTVSTEKSANFTVMSPIFGDLPFDAIDIGDGFYVKKQIEMSLLDEGIEAGTIPDSIPIFGGKEFKINLAPSVEIYADSTGKVEGSLAATDEGSSEKKTKTSVAGLELSLGSKLTITGDYQYPGCYYQWGGSIGLEGNVTGSKSWPFVLPGPIPLPMYAKASVELTGNALIGVTNLNPVERNGELSINPYVRGSLGAGIDEMFSVEGWIGGGANATLQYPNEPHLKDIQVYVNGGFSAYALLWRWEQESMCWDWNLSDSQLYALSVPAASYSVPQLVKRDYLNNTGTFSTPVEEVVKASSVTGQSYAVAITPLQTSIFPYSEPLLSSAGNAVHLIWLTDNNLRTSINRTMAQFSQYNGSSWSAPQAIVDDGTADFAPTLLTFEDGTTIAAWEDEKSILPDTATFDDMLRNLEISVARFDPISRIWQPLQRLTSNGWLDRSPKLAGNSKDNVMAVWIENEGNDIQGNAAHPNKVWCTLYNGTTWSAPQLAGQVPFGIVKYSLAYDGIRARLVMSLDTDSDSTTITDHDLYFLPYDGGTWGTLTRLPDNDTEPIADDNPQVALDPANNFVLTWLKGAEVSSVVNFDMNYRSVIMANGEYSSNLADFKLVKATDGKMAMVWTEPSDNSSDIFASFYDPIHGLWGSPKQLTFDGETEKNVTAAFFGTGTILAVYNRTLMGQTTEVGTDLYMLTHTMGDDLALQMWSLAAIPQNPEPGDPVTFVVKAQNLGDTTLTSIPITFYQGDPGNGGIKIGETTIAGPFKPGDEQEVSLYWTTPATSSPIAIYAVIDPEASMDPINRGNNMATVTITKPDLSFSAVNWSKLSDTLISVTVRVANNGALPSPPTAVTLRQDSPTGAILGTQSLALLAGGQAVDINFIWNVTGLPNEQYKLYAIADENNAVSEFNEANNTASVLIPVNLSNITTTLSIQMGGTGTGIVSSTPTGLACNTDCLGLFPWGTDVTVHATPAPYSVFTGWSEPYSGASDLTVSLSGATSLMAVFDYDLAHKARIFGPTPSYYPTIAAAINAAALGDLVQLWAQPFSESLVLDKPIVLKGGYDSSYASNSGWTLLQGTLTIGRGSLIVEKMVIQ